MKFVLMIAFMLTFIVIWPAGAVDSHAGYYYPKPVTQEQYRPRVRKMPGTNKQGRVAFVSNFTNGIMIKNPYLPQFAIFSAGARRQKLIIVALRDEAYNTIFRARALLAQLTAVARTTPIIREQMKSDDLTFLDVLNLIGFEQLTISDGKTYSHQIHLR